MKSMIIKDLYNLGHNAKQLVLLLVFLAVCMIPSGGLEALAVEFAVLCGMMTITTFSFDEKSKWEKYAMVMPVSRSEYVLAKYANTVVYGMAGVAGGWILSLLIGLFTRKLNLTVMVGCGIAGIVCSLLLGSLMIPLVIRFGSEHARMIMLGCVAVPSLLFLAVYKAAPVLGSGAVWAICAAAAVLIAVWLIVSPILSIRWFCKKEF